MVHVYFTHFIPVQHLKFHTQNDFFIAKLYNIFMRFLIITIDDGATLFVGTKRYVSNT